MDNDVVTNTQAMIITIYPAFLWSDNNTLAPSVNQTLVCFKTMVNTDKIEIIIMSVMINPEAITHFRYLIDPM